MAPIEKYNPYESSTLIPSRKNLWKDIKNYLDADWREGLRKAQEIARMKRDQKEGIIESSISKGLDWLKGTIKPRAIQEEDWMKQKGATPLPKNQNPYNLEKYKED